MTLLIKSLRKKKGIRRYVGPKRVIFLLIFAGLIVFAWDIYKRGNFSPVLIEQYKNQYPIGAILLFVLIYAVSVITSLPSLPLNLAAGFFWGGGLGGIYSTIAVTLGGWVSFLTARWFIGKPLAQHFGSHWASKIQEEFEQNGWKFVAFARLNPIIPTGPLNYLLGLTSLSNRCFLWITFIFLLPPSIAVSYIGEILQTFTIEQVGVKEIIRDILILSGSITAMAIIKFASKIYKKT